VASVSARALIEAVAIVMSRAKASGLESYEEAERLLDPDLERRLYGAPPEPQFQQLVSGADLESEVRQQRADHHG
jgi:hypothetical protein